MDGGDILSGQIRGMPGSLPGRTGPQERFAQAFAECEFVLYSQTVRKLNSRGDRRPHTEIYVRLQEEEENVVPPGTFLPRLEHYNLGPQLDQYVLRQALTWHCGNRQQAGFILHINLCQGTLVDLEFPAIVITELKAVRCGADSLCFEIPDIDGPADPLTLEFARRLKAVGCHIAVGIDRPERITFLSAKNFAADYMKFGGSLIRDVTSNMGSAARLRALTRACQTFGIQTVAQHVEDRDTLAMLGDLGVDYAQGYEISRPAPMEASP